MPNYITLFKSRKALTENHPVQSGKIKIEETLQPGEYEFGLYDKTSEKGNLYRRGTIRPVFKKEVKPFSEPVEAKVSSNLNPDLDYDDSIPF